MSETGGTDLKAGSGQLAASRKQISSLQDHRCMLRAFWCQLQVYSMLYAPCSMLFHNGQLTLRDSGISLRLIASLRIGFRVVELPQYIREHRIQMSDRFRV
jgi:hypothetical protein